MAAKNEKTKAGGDDAVARYFQSIGAALKGLDIFLADESSPLYRHGLVAQAIMPYVKRLEASFEGWQDKLSYTDSFKISRAESGFPVYQQVLQLELDQRNADKRLADIPEPKALRSEMADFILRHKEFPTELKKLMAERVYLEAVKEGEVFTSFVLPETIRVSVNPKTGRPFYMVHWGVFDGASHLPLIYSLLVEDSDKSMVETLVSDGTKLNKDVDIPLPVGGILNPKVARGFDQFAESNSSYSLSPITIAKNLDETFEELHPKQLRRIVLGPFYSAGLTDNNETVSHILSNVSKPENSWLLTWTIQDVFSQTERPARRGLWSSEPAREEFHINTDDLEATRMGVSSYEKHALIPHEAYQALYAAGEAQKIFSGYQVHIISGGQVISDV